MQTVRYWLKRLQCMRALVTSLWQELKKEKLTQFQENRFMWFRIPSDFGLKTAD